MTIITKGMGAVIKKFGKKTAKHMADTETRHKSWKKMGLKGPKYRVGKKVKGSHHLDEVWTYDKNYRTKKSLGGILKGLGKIGKGIGSKLGKKKAGPKALAKPEPKIGSKEWFDKAGPFERRKYLSMRESARKGDVYNRAGQIMGRPHSERSAKSIKKYVGPGAHQKGRPGKAIGGLLKQGFKVLKGPANKFRMEQAKNLKKHRLKTKIEKGRAGREARKIVSDWDKKHVSSNPELKRAMSQARHPKSWRRQITKKLKETK